jgi:hypothetical protein
MTQNPFRNETITRSNYLTRTPAYYFQTIDPELRNSFTAEQTEVIHALLEAAIPKPNPKLVDLRFTVDLVLSRFYVVLFVGKDRRQQTRSYFPSSMSRLGNVVAAVLLLLGLNLLISLLLFLLAYLIKSAVGIDLFPDSHLSDQLQKLH